MSMFSTLSRKAPDRVFLGILLGAFSGVVYSLLIPLLMGALQPGDPRFEVASTAPTYLYKLEIANAPIALLFGVACILIVVCRTLSQVVLTTVAMAVASDLRVKLYERIACAPVATLERMGSARLVTTITTDVPRIVLGAQVLPALLISAVTLLGMLSFLLYLNAEVFWFVLECIFFGAVTFQFPMFLAKRFFVRAGRSSDALQKSVDGLIRGIKELKLNDAKRRAYFETDLIANEQALFHAQKTGNTVMNMANSYGNMICFFAIGAVTFIFVNYHSVRNQDLIGVVMALLYITGPIAVILNMMPQLAVARVSFERVTALLAELPDEGIQPPSTIGNWKSLRLRQVCYQHHATDESPGFKVGPFDLEFHKGEVTFIVGGNGSGKSTLCKLLTLHYVASAGEIYFGNHLITPETISTYRQDIVAIYSDYYLFDRVLGKIVEQDVVEHYLSVLKLDKKVTYKDGKFSTLLLSDGQRRRMALVAAFIEDKELYLFDEWAADQDPSFKEAFYHEILPSLKAKGKAVVVITHDDRYFHVADKVITMTDGVVSNVRLGAIPANTGSVNAEHMFAK
jgi:putative ATP-binding cassette transporter